MQKEYPSVQTSSAGTLCRGPVRRMNRWVFFSFLVEVTGFEPATPCSQSTYATNCATPRNCILDNYIMIFPNYKWTSPSKNRIFLSAIAATSEIYCVGSLMHGHLSILTFADGVPFVVFSSLEFRNTRLLMPPAPNESTDR